MKDIYENFVFDYDEFGDIDYRRLLHEAGFKDVRIYGDYDKSPYDEGSKRLIVVAK